MTGMLYAYGLEGTRARRDNDVHKAEANPIKYSVIDSLNMDLGESFIILFYLLALKIPAVRKGQVVFGPKSVSRTQISNNALCGFEVK